MGARWFTLQEKSLKSLLQYVKRKIRQFHSLSLMKKVLYKHRSSTKCTVQFYNTVIYNLRHCWAAQTRSSSSLSLREFPFLPTHRALLNPRLRLEPFHDAVHVERVAALAPNEGTIVAGRFTFAAARVERHTAYAARIVVRYPLPMSHCLKIFNATSKKYAQFSHQIHRASHSSVSLQQL